MSDILENSFYLPEHLISNILLRLPVKSVLVCTSVCKSWNSFIKSPSFISSHLSRTISSYKNNGARLFLLQLGSCSLAQIRPTYTFFLRSDDEKLSEYSSIHFPYNHKDGFQVISSCNGLVLLMNGGYTKSVRNLILWNPVIRKSLIILPDQNIQYLEAAGLGIDSRTGDYKVLTIIRENFVDKLNTLKVELYSFKANSWKQLPDLEATPYRFMKLHREMIFVNGALHFIAFREFRFLILCFDLDAEIFHEIELPECMSQDMNSDSLSLWEFDETLSVLWQRKTEQDVERHIWVMEKYGDRESWIHLSTVDHDDGALASPFHCTGFVNRNDTNVVLSYFIGKCIPSLMVSHDLKSRETNFGFFEGKSNCYFLGNYVESLLLLDKGDDLSMVFEPDSCNSNDGASFDAQYNSKIATCSMAHISYSSDEESAELGDDMDGSASDGSSGAASENGSETDVNEDSASDASFGA